MISPEVIRQVKQDWYLVQLYNEIMSKPEMTPKADTLFCAYDVKYDYLKGFPEVFGMKIFPSNAMPESQVLMLNRGMFELKYNYDNYVFTQAENVKGITIKVSSNNLPYTIKSI